MTPSFREGHKPYHTPIECCVCRGFSGVGRWCCLFSSGESAPSGLLRPRFSFVDVLVKRVADTDDEGHHLVPTPVRLATSLPNGGATYTTTRFTKKMDPRHHLVATSKAIAERGQDRDVRFGAFSLFFALGLGVGRDKVGYNGSVFVFFSRKRLHALDA